MRWDKKPNDEYVLYPERFQANLITVMHSDTESLTDTENNRAQTSASGKSQLTDFVVLSQSAFLSASLSLVNILCADLFSSSFLFCTCSLSLSLA